MSHRCLFWGCADLTWAFGDLVERRPSSLLTQDKGVLIGPFPSDLFSWLSLLHPHQRLLIHTFRHSPRTHCLPSFMSFPFCQYPPCFGNHGNRWTTIPIFARCLCHPAQHAYCRVLFLCLFNVPKPEVRCIWTRTPHMAWFGTCPSDSFRACLLCVFVYVCVRLFLSALEHCANKFSLCRNGQEKKKFTNLVTGKFCFRERYVGLFLGIYVAYTFQDFCQHN